MSTLLLYRSAIASTLAADSRLSGVNVYTHGGAFDLLELKEYANKLPAIALSITRAEPVSVGGEAFAGVSVSLVAMAKDQPGLRRDARVLQIVEAVINILRRHPNQRWGITAFEIGQVSDIVAENLYTRKLDAEGVAFWGVVFHQLVQMNAVQVTDDLGAIAIKYDLYPRDNDAPIGTPSDPQPDGAVIDAEDFVDLS